MTLTIKSRCFNRDDATQNNNGYLVSRAHRRMMMAATMKMPLLSPSSLHCFNAHYLNRLTSRNDRRLCVQSSSSSSSSNFLPSPQPSLSPSPSPLHILFNPLHKINNNRLRLPNSSSSDFSAITDSAEQILSKYMGGGGNKNNNNSRKPSSSTMGNGVFLLLIINFALHAISYVWHPTWMALLPLSHFAPKWYQFITAAFVHASWEHLLGNAFSLLIFGRMVEEEEGSFGVWMTYLVCGLGGNIASYLTSPGTRAISLGASSAVFGLFIVGVVTKLKPSVRRLLEAVILGTFAFKQVAQEVAIVMSNGGGGGKVIAGGMSVGHAAHLGGAAAGVLLIVLLSRIDVD